MLATLANQPTPPALRPATLDGASASRREYKRKLNEKVKLTEIRGWTEKPLGTVSSRLHPGGDGLTKFLLSARRRLSAQTWRPGPTHQRIFRHVLDEFLETHAVIFNRVFNRLTKLTIRQSLPPHRAWRQSPLRSSGHFRVVIIRSSVTGVASHSYRPVIVNSSLHILSVRVQIISLRRLVSCRMAIHTARVTNHSRCFHKQLNRFLLTTLRLGLGWKEWKDNATSHT